MDEPTADATPPANGAKPADYFARWDKYDPDAELARLAKEEAREDRQKARAAAKGGVHALTARDKARIEGASTASARGAAAALTAAVLALESKCFKSEDSLYSDQYL